jgi:hypothetical protein
MLSPNLAACALVGRPPPNLLADKIVDVSLVTLLANSGIRSNTFYRMLHKGVQ